MIKATSRYCNDVVRGWDRFWFKPVDPTHLSLLRIATGMMLVYTHAVWGLALTDFFGPYSWLDPEVVQEIQSGRPLLSFWWYVPAGWEAVVHWTAVSVLVCFMVGFLTPVTKILAFLIAISYAHRSPTALFGLDQINCMLTLYLALGPCGARLSVDAWLRRKRGKPLIEKSTAANLSLRLIQLQMCAIYFYAGLSKLKGEFWWNGEAMWMAFGNLEYQTYDMTWMARHPYLVNLSTHITVIWELSFCVLIWRPLLRPLVLAAGVVMHLGIGFALGMWTFGLIMLVGCASFLPSDTLARWFSRAKSVKEPEAETPAIENDEDYREFDDLTPAADDVPVAATNAERPALASSSTTPTSSSPAREPHPHVQARTVAAQHVNPQTEAPPNPSSDFDDENETFRPRQPR